MVKKKTGICSNLSDLYHAFLTLVTGMILHALTLLKVICLPLYYTKATVQIILVAYNIRWSSCTSFYILLLLHTIIANCHHTLYLPSTSQKFLESWLVLPCTLLVVAQGSWNAFPKFVWFSGVCCFTDVVVVIILITVLFAWVGYTCAGKNLVES